MVDSIIIRVDAQSKMDICGEQSAETSKRILLIAVHLGASNSRNNYGNEELAKSVCKSVMQRSSPALGCGSNRDRPNSNSSLISTAEEAVVLAVELMERDKSLNCGLGSNLNIQGKVECDASLMSSKNQIWTGVGAVSGCKSPIRLAKSLYDHIACPRPLGLVQPNFLVASGAKQWMRDKCPNLVVPDSYLISSRSLHKYQEMKSRHDLACKTQNSTETNCDIVMDSEKSTQALDTVGAVAVDCDNNFACAISSGGIILKNRGRVGQAGVPGAGCWAQDFTAVTTTGVGEYLTATLFAKKFHDKMQTAKLLHDLDRSRIKPASELSPSQARSLLIREAMNQCFTDLLDSLALGHVPLSDRLAGMLALGSFRTDLTFRHQDVNERGKEPSEGNSNLYLCYGHNTRSLCIGYMRANDTEAVSFVSHNDGNDGEKTEYGSTSPSVGIVARTIELR